MFNVYETIIKLCDEHGITPGKMCNDLGMSRSTMTELKKGRSQTLKLEKAARIANYFGVPLEALTGTGQKEAPAQGEGELQEYLEELRNRPEQRAMFKLTSKATKEEVEAAVAIVDAYMRSRGLMGDE